LVILAKQHFKPDALPTSSEMWFKFSVDERCAPDAAESDTLYGPDTGMLGLFHSCVLLAGASEMVVDGSEEFLGDGAPPMMPPSTNFTPGAAVWKRDAISREVRGDMAFRSR
jgi:hypothetical protein